MSFCMKQQSVFQYLSFCDSASHLFRFFICWLLSLCSYYSCMSVSVSCLLWLFSLITFLQGVISLGRLIPGLNASCCLVSVASPATLSSYINAVSEYIELLFLLCDSDFAHLSFSSMYIDHHSAAAAAAIVLHSAPHSFQSSFCRQTIAQPWRRPASNLPACVQLPFWLFFSQTKGHYFTFPDLPTASEARRSAVKPLVEPTLVVSHNSYCPFSMFLRNQTD